MGRKSNKTKYLIIGIILLIGLVWAYDSGYIDEIKPKSLSPKSFDFEDFNKNPQNYLGQNITINAEYGGFDGFHINECGGGVGTMYYLIDNNGYKVNFCESIDREFEVGKSYTISGTFREGTFEWPMGSEKRIILFED